MGIAEDEPKTVDELTLLMVMDRGLSLATAQYLMRYIRAVTPPVEEIELDRQAAALLVANRLRGTFRENGQQLTWKAVSEMMQRYRKYLKLGMLGSGTYRRKAEASIEEIEEDLEKLKQTAKDLESLMGEAEAVLERAKEIDSDRP